jgi:hypothetical protein
MSEEPHVHVERNPVLGSVPVHFRDLPSSKIFPVKLSETEARVLSAWDVCQVGIGFGFSVASKRSGVEEHRIRRAVRALARKGCLDAWRWICPD